MVPYQVVVEEKQIKGYKNVLVKFWLVIHDFEEDEGYI